MKVGMVGTGLVGSTSSYAIVMRGVARELVLVDIDPKRAQSEADDILHAVPFAHPVNVHAGSYKDLAGCRVVVITAGVSQRPGENRLQLLERNAAIFKNVIPAVVEQAPESVLLVATNPVDVMTHLAVRLAMAMGVPSGRVLGTGTTLDTARLRSLLGRHLGIDSQHVHAYVLGEHGDSEVLAWSQVTVAGIPLEEFCRLRHTTICEEDYELIEDQVRNAAYHIIEGKGATYYGIGSAIARIVEVILRDQRSLLTVCTPVDEIEGVKDVTLALPNLVGGSGVLATFRPVLDEHEKVALRQSAQVVKQAIEMIV